MLFPSLVSLTAPCYPLGLQLHFPMKHGCLALRAIPDPPCWADWSVWQTPAGLAKGLPPEGGEEGQSLWALCMLQSPLTSHPLLELDSTSAIRGQPAWIRTGNSWSARRSHLPTSQPDGVRAKPSQTPVPYSCLGSLKPVTSLSQERGGDTSPFLTGSGALRGFRTCRGRDGGRVKRDHSGGSQPLCCTVLLLLFLSSSVPWRMTVHVNHLCK